MTNPSPSLFPLGSHWEIQNPTASDEEVGWSRANLALVAFRPVEHVIVSQIYLILQRMLLETYLRQRLVDIFVLLATEQWSHVGSRSRVCLRVCSSQ